MNIRILRIWTSLKLFKLNIFEIVIRGLRSVRLGSARPCFTGIGCSYVLRNRYQLGNISCQNDKLESFSLSWKIPISISIELPNFNSFFPISFRTSHYFQLPFPTACKWKNSSLETPRTTIRKRESICNVFATYTVKLFEVNTIL